MDEPLVVNLADAPAYAHPRRATVLELEGEEHWPEVGVNVAILAPGQPNCRYHSESVQEDFLVLRGECIAIVQGYERPLRQWDLLHCPAGVEHVFVGAGEEPCAILMIGSRRVDECHYPLNELAARYDASAPETTDDPARAYADWEAQAQWAPVANPWREVAGEG